MKGDGSVELLEEGDSISDEDRQDRVAKFIGEAEAKTLGGEHTAADEPDVAERGPQARVDELRKIAGIELDALAGSGKSALRENEGGLVAVGPPEPSGLEAERRLIGVRAHDVAVDRIEEGLDGCRIHRFSRRELVRCLEPVDAAVPPRDEAVEARRHVNRYAGNRACHRLVPTG